MKGLLTSLLLLPFLNGLAGFAEESLANENKKNGTEVVEAHITERHPLTFEAFIEKIKQNHPALKIAEVDKQIASAKRLERQGAFDPTANSTTYFNRYNSATELGKAKQAIESNTSIDLLTRYGAKLSVGGKLVAGDITPPLYPTGETGEYFVEMKLPLLRGRGINGPLAAEKKGLLGEELAQALYTRQRLNLLMKASETYWKWVATHQKYEVAQQLLKLAEIRMKAVEVQARHGDMPAISVVESKQEVKKRLGRLHAVLRDLQQATYNLSSFLWEDTGLPTVEFPDSDNMPVEIASPVYVDKDRLQEAKLTALQLRPELRAVAISREITQVDRKLARNNLLPQLDAFVNSGYETGQYSIGPTVRAGVTMSVPFRQRAAKGQLMQAELGLERISFDEKQVLRQIFLEIADALSAVNTSYERHKAALEEWDAAKQMEQGERLSLTEGESTLFLVNQRERATAEARLQVIDALADYNRARVMLQTATGELAL